jgi:hypothetical protein
MLKHNHGHLLLGAVIGAFLLGTWPAGPCRGEQWPRIGF